MNIGKLNKRLILQSPTETRDDHGGYDETWTDEATVWGAIEPLRGQELTNAQQVNPLATVKIRIRPYSGLTSKWRIQWYEA